MRGSRHKKSSLPSLICLKAGQTFVNVSPSPLYQGQKLITGDNFRPLSAQRAPEESIQQTLLTRPYLPLVPPYIYLPTICCRRSSMSFSFVLSLLHKFIVLWLRGYRSPSSNHLFELHIPCVCVLHVLINFFLFFLFCLLSEPQLENLEGRRKVFFFSSPTLQ